MSGWLAALKRPENNPESAHAWFSRMATVLLTRAALRVGTETFRIAEVEAYDFSPGHADPFAHRHQVQERTGYWYFHRVGCGFRGGSYKGMDLTFGTPGVPSGLLIRAVVRDGGPRTDGPSRVTDAILRAAGCATVAELDRGCCRADAPGSTLRLIDAPESPAEVMATARVGLSLKTHTATSIASAADFLLRPYRFLTDPRSTRTGRVQLAHALLRSGLDGSQVASRAGFRPHAVVGYQRAIEAGRGCNLAAFAGRVLSGREWLELAGAAES